MSTVFIDALAWWPRTPGAPRPLPTLLAANERRRAPESVLLALALAEEAVRQAGLEASVPASVFTSAHGDLAIVDALCRTLADDPLMLSPTRFHHSVHNAASGYWAIGAHNPSPSTALAGFDHSFAAGWLEAVAQCLADQRPVLLVGCDTEARGPLASVNTSRGTLGVALVMRPEPGPATRWRAQTGLLPQVAAPTTAARADLAANALADALPLCEALDAAEPARLALALGPTLSLDIRLQPLAAAGASSAP